MDSAIAKMPFAVLDADVHVLTAFCRPDKSHFGGHLGQFNASGSVTSGNLFTQGLGTGRSRTWLD
jgi:hypothetical protein